MMEPSARSRDLAYRVVQATWSRWALLRHRREFDRVRAFVLFVGYPRSGHSIVGAILNSHRSAVISHELNAAELILDGCTRNQLYARILARAGWFDLRGNVGTYPFAIPGGWQGRFEDLQVIGDKRGGAMTRAITAHPDLLARIRSLVRVPLRLVHVVRNPLDNVAAISLRESRTLRDATDYYLRHCETTSRLNALCEHGELITLHHEAMIGEPDASILRLCGFLELEVDPGYLASCRRALFHQPTETRTTVRWPPGLVREIERRAAAHPFLAAYG